MFATKLTFLTLWIQGVLTYPNTAEVIRRDPNTKLILWGTRHGNRNPEQLVFKTPSVWGFEGNTELTQRASSFSIEISAERSDIFSKKKGYARKV
ncbi:hypothetical protein ANCDUO_08826 [Ancylostoma duodenale]|uniref:Secreted protein n=1 Tax=Ancylostoma duodenale TaxID=51022 RepID=A0A0C2CVK7_9BILA|nr:hypothetical protein ANCDUO_08826 [Ancylostoma duodenale]